MNMFVRILIFASAIGLFIALGCLFSRAQSVYQQDHKWCRSSGRQVLDEGARHATWRMIDDHKCWYAGRPRRAERKVMHDKRPPRVPIARGAAREISQVPSFEERWWFDYDTSLTSDKMYEMIKRRCGC